MCVCSSVCASLIAPEMVGLVGWQAGWQGGGVSWGGWGLGGRVKIEETAVWGWTGGSLVGARKMFAGILMLI